MLGYHDGENGVAVRCAIADGYEACAICEARYTTTPCTYCGEPTETPADEPAVTCTDCQRRYHLAADEARRTRGGYGVADETEVGRIATAAITAQGRWHRHAPTPPADPNDRAYAYGYVPCGRCGTFILPPGPLDDPESHYVADGLGGWLCTPNGILRDHDAIVEYDLRSLARHHGAGNF